MEYEFNELVSLIMPGHTKINELNKRVLISIFNQTYQVLELCILLSGISKIDFDEWVSFIENNYGNNKNVQIIHKENAISPGIARKELIRLSSGKFIVFADSDDILDKTLIEKKVKISKTNQVNVVFSNAYVFNHVKYQDKGLDFQRNYKLNFHLRLLFGNSIFSYMLNYLPNSGTLILKNNDTLDALNNYPTEKHEDFIFFSRLFKKNIKLALIDEPLISYYINNRTTTGNKFSSRLWHYYATKKIFPNEKNLKLFFITLIGTLAIILIRVFHRFKKIRNTNSVLIYKKF